MATPISVKVLYNHDYTQHQLLNPVIHWGLQTALSNTRPNISGVEGQMCYTSDTNTLWYHNGTDNGTGQAIEFAGWTALGSAGAGIQGVNPGLRIDVTGTTNVTIDHETIVGTGTSTGNTGLQVLQNLILSNDDTGHVESYNSIDLASLLDNYIQWNLKYSDGTHNVTTHRQVELNITDSSMSASISVGASATDPNAVDNDLTLNLGHSTSFSPATAGTYSGGLVYNISVNSEGHVLTYNYATPASIGLTTEAFRVISIGTVANIGANTGNIVADQADDTLTFKAAPGSGLTQIAIELKTDPTTDALHVAHAATTGLPSGGQTVPAYEVLNGISIDEYGHLIGFSSINVPQNYDTNLGNTNLVQTAPNRTYQLTDNQADSLKFNVDHSTVQRPMLHFDTSNGAETIHIGDGTLNPKLIVYGDLDVRGDTTILDTETVVIEDNIILLNKNATAPGADAGLEVQRDPVMGGPTNVQWIWNEANDYWIGPNEKLAVGNSSILASGDISHFWVEDNSGASGVLNRATPATVRTVIGAGTMSSWTIEADQGGAKTTSDITDTEKVTIKNGTNVTVAMTDQGTTNPKITINVPPASTSVKGAIEIATNTEARSGSSTSLALTPNHLRHLSGYVQFTGDGVTTSFVLAHNWATPYVMVEVIEDDIAVNYQTVKTGVSREDLAGAPSLNHVKILFGHAPANGKLYTAFLWGLPFAVSL